MTNLALVMSRTSITAEIDLFLNKYISLCIMTKEPLVPALQRLPLKEDECTVVPTGSCESVVFMI